MCFARGQRFKLYDDGRLFDTRTDPDELSPLPAGEHATLRAKLQRHLDAMPPEPEHLR